MVLRCTAPGLSGQGEYRKYRKIPLMFNVEVDPSESLPLNVDTTNNGTTVKPSNDTHPDAAVAMDRILKAYAFEVATFTYGINVPEPDGPNEGPGTYGVCCNRTKHCNCNSDDDGDVDVTANIGVGGGGLFSIGTKQHHDAYHEVLGEEEPSPTRTRAQEVLLQQN